MVKILGAARVLCDDCTALGPKYKRAESVMKDFSILEISSRPEYPDYPMLCDYCNEMRQNPANSAAARHAHWRSVGYNPY